MEQHAHFSCARDRVSNLLDPLASLVTNTHTLAGSSKKWNNVLYQKYLYQQLPHTNVHVVQVDTCMHKNNSYAMYSEFMHHL